MNQHRQLQLLLGIAAYLVAGTVFANTNSGGGSPGGGGAGCAISVSGQMADGVMCQFQAAAQQINQSLIQPAIATAVAAMMLQWIISYWKDLFKPDITDILLKAAGLITWFGVTVLLIKNMDRMSTMFTEYLALSGGLSGVSLSPGAIIEKTMDMIGATNEAFKAAANKIGVTDVFKNMGAALMLFFANIFTFLAGLMVALSVFVSILEFWMMFAVAPLAFGLIPLSAFRDQGFAPIKGLISLGLRILILGVVVAVFTSLTNVVIAAMKASGGDSTTIMESVWYYLAGMAGCAMMALYAGKIASAIASGSASFSGSDAIRGGMALTTTAAAGAAGATVAGKALLGGAANGAAGLGKAAGLSMPSAESMGRAAGSVTGRMASFGQPFQVRPGGVSGGSNSSSGGGSSGRSSGGSSGDNPSDMQHQSSNAVPIDDRLPGDGQNENKPSTGSDRSNSNKPSGVPPTGSGSSSATPGVSVPSGGIGMANSVSAGASTANAGAVAAGNVGNAGIGAPIGGRSTGGASPGSSSGASPSVGVGGGTSAGSPSGSSSSGTRSATRSATGNSSAPSATPERLNTTATNETIDNRAKGIDPVPGGDASTAGIGGPVGEKPSTSNGRQSTFSDRIKDAAQQNAQDTHSVSIQMHVGKD